MNKDIETLFSAATGVAPAAPPASTENTSNIPPTPAVNQQPAWLQRLEDPNYDPFAPNFNTSSEPDLEPTNETPSADNANPVEEPTTSEPVVENQLTPEQLQQLDNERRAAEAAMEGVLEKFYSIPDEIKSTLPDGVSEFLQKQQVKAHKAVVNHISAMLNNIQQTVLPNLVANLVENQSKVADSEKQFYNMFPQLKDPNLKKDILDAAQVLAPKLQGKNLKERMTMIGSYVALIKGLDPRPSTGAGSISNAASAGGNTPPSNGAPIIPSRAASAVPAGGANNRNQAAKNSDVASLWSAFNQ